MIEKEKALETILEGSIINTVQTVTMGIYTLYVKMLIP